MESAVGRREHPPASRPRQREDADAADRVRLERLVPHHDHEIAPAGDAPRGDDRRRAPRESGRCSPRSPPPGARRRRLPRRRSGRSRSSSWDSRRRWPPASRRRSSSRPGFAALRGRWCGRGWSPGARSHPSGCAARPSPPAREAPCSACRGLRSCGSRRGLATSRGRRAPPISCGPSAPGAGPRRAEPDPGAAGSASRTGLRRPRAERSRRPWPYRGPILEKSSRRLLRWSRRAGSVPSRGSPRPGAWNRLSGEGIAPPRRAAGAIFSMRATPSGCAARAVSGRLALGTSALPRAGCGGGCAPTIPREALRELRAHDFGPLLSISPATVLVAGHLSHAGRVPGSLSQNRWASAARKRSDFPDVGPTREPKPRSRSFEATSKSFGAASRNSERFQRVPEPARSPVRRDREAGSTPTTGGSIR